MKCKKGIIIEARTSSVRLPKKTLKKICGKPTIQLLIERVKKVSDVDVVILATGYKPQEHLVAKLFGQEIADRVGPIWGYGDGLELRNMYRPTGQPGLWMIAGSFAQCRINSKYLALQIKAVEAALI